jgi:phosphate transport system substrate-binding protein
MVNTRIAATLILVISVASCGSEQSTVPVDAPGMEHFTPTAEIPAMAIDSNNYPHVDGSTSTHPLQTRIACHLLQVECEWVVPFLSPDGTRRYLPKSYLMASGELGPSELVVTGIEHAGTHGSYENLILGDTDLILVARLPSDDELRLAEERGIELVIEPIAFDAFVFLINAQNPVQDLTVDHIRSIFSGDTKYWDELGVTGWPEELRPTDDGYRIQPYLRNQNSGSQELMENLVMGDLAMIDGPDMIIIGGMGPVFSAMHMDPLGIGYSVYYYAVYMLPTDGVKLLAVDGVFPDAASIADGTYSFTTQVYAVIRSDLLETEPAHWLFEWIQSPEGQAVITSSGYVPIN